MLPKKFTFPFDPSGLLVSNKILNESHTITPANGKDYRFIIPKGAPYFERSVKLIHTSTGKTMIKGTDWVPGHRFAAASQTPPFASVYGSILITDDTLSGSFHIESYQTLGGEFTIDETTALNLLANKLLDPRLTTWDKVINAPLVQDPLAHLHHVSQSIGWDAVVAVLNELVTKYTAESSRLAQRIQTHLEDHSDPHKISLEQIGLERFREVTRATIEKILEGTDNLGYVTPLGLQSKVSKLTEAIGTTSYQGNLPFYSGSSELFSSVADIILGNVAIVENPTDLTKQLAARESFLSVYNSWQRIAMTGNNLAGLPAELTGWTYDSAADAVKSTINSSSLIGLYSPDQISGDYVFEVEVSSTNADDDFIGLGLGLAQYGGKMRNLSLMRSASISGASLQLVYDYGQPGAVVLAQITGLVTPPTGWANYTGIVKVMVRRVGNVLYISTTNPGTAYLPEVSYDLTARETTKMFAGPVNLGYTSFSQLGATWKTLRRTGANPAIAALHTQQLHVWNGTAYALSATPIKDVVLRGRFYRNNLMSRTYFCPASGTAIKITDSAATFEPTSALAQRGRLVKVESDGVTHMGNRALLTESDGVAGCSVRTNAGKLEFLNPAGAVMAHFDTAGKLQHSGVNSNYSDVRLKDELVMISDAGLFPYYSWVWKALPTVPMHLRGTKGYGVLAQDVQAKLPQFVSQDVNGFLMLDETKLALYFAMVGHSPKAAAEMYEIHTSKE